MIRELEGILCYLEHGEKCRIMARAAEDRMSRGTLAAVADRWADMAAQRARVLLRSVVL